MTLYTKYWKSNYDELITYYPRFYREVLEMDAILRAEGGLLDGIDSGIDAIYSNNFIQTADAATIKEWEELLDIVYSSSLTLDQRRSVIIALLIGNGHIGEPEIREIIAQYTDKSVAVDFDSGIIYIVIEGEVFDEDNLLAVLNKKKPAHLGLDMKINIIRSFTQNLNISFGGATAAELNISPQSEDRTARTELYAGFGGRVVSEFSADFVGEDRTHTNAVEIASGGFLSPNSKGDWLDVKKDSRGVSQAVGGIYCTTHVHSKLIE